MMRFDGYTRDSSFAFICGIFAAPIILFITYAVSLHGWPILFIKDSGLEKISYGVMPTIDDLSNFQPIDLATQFFSALHDGKLTALLTTVSQRASLDAICDRLELCAAIAAIGVFVVAALVLPACSWRAKDGSRQLKGRRLVLPPDGARAARRDFAEEYKKAPPQSRLAPGVKLPWEHEVKGILLVGAPGSGKTEIIKWMLSQWIKRGTRLIVLDACKGDYTSEWPTDDFYLLAPHDDRTQPGPNASLNAVAWDIARDCTSFQDAAEFAARVILESREPQWAEGARLILQGAIVGLQRTKGKAWGWRDLHNVVTLPDADLNVWMKVHFSPAVRYTAVDQSGNASKTAGSYLTNCCATVIKFTLPLSLAWGDTPRERRLSVRHWLLSGKGAQAIILGRSGQFSAMSAAWIGSLIRLINSVVQSPALGNDPNRRVLIVLDELRTIAAPDDCITALAEIGRSKGIGTVSGIQSFDQFRDEKVWGDAGVTAFEGVMQTKIIGKQMTTSSGAGGANAIAENVIGKGTFERRQKSRTVGGGKGATVSIVMQQEERLVVEPQFFEQLAPTLRGPLAGYLSPRSFCLLTWPWSGWKARRPAVVPARWIDGLDTETAARIGYTEVDPFKLAVDSRLDMIKESLGWGTQSATPSTSTQTPVRP